MSLQAQQQALQRAILGTQAGGVSPLEGLEVYRHAVTARLIAALRDNYLVLHRAMGDEDFDALANAYLQQHASQQPSIRWFGHRLAEFMLEWEPLPHPALADMARMDWALRAAFDAPNALALHELAGLDASSQFTLHPSVRLVSLDWAVEPAWRALRVAITEETDEPELPEPQAQSHTLLVWRLGLEVRWRSLDAPEADLLWALQEEGADFAALGQRAAIQMGEEAAPAALVQALRTWLAEGLLQA